MNLKKFLVLSLVVSGWLSITTIHAETINMRSIGDSPTGVMKPHHGMSMNSVLQQFGEPESRQNPVGEPPITRWDFCKVCRLF